MFDDFSESIDPILKVNGTSFFDSGNMLRIFLLIKLIPNRMLNISLSMMWTVSIVKKSRMRT